MDAAAWRERERQRQREREQERELGKEGERILYGGPTFTRATFKVVRAPSPEKRAQDKPVEDSSNAAMAMPAAAPHVRAVPSAHHPSSTSTEGESEVGGSHPSNPLPIPALKRVWSAGRARPRSPAGGGGNAASEQLRVLEDSGDDGEAIGKQRHRSDPSVAALSSSHPPLFRRQCSADASIPRRDGGDVDVWREGTGSGRGYRDNGSRRYAGESVPSGMSSRMETSSNSSAHNAVQLMDTSAAGLDRTDIARDPHIRTDIPTEEIGGAATAPKAKDRAATPHRSARRTANDEASSDRRRTAEKRAKRPVRIKYETSEPGINGRREISYASLGKLVARLTDAHQYDCEFRDAFLLSYRCFCSPYEFVKKLIKRYTAVMALCGTIDMNGDQNSPHNGDDDGPRSRHASTSSLTKRQDAHSNAEANLSVMRVLSVLKYWIKESKFIELDLYSDRRAQKKLLAFLSEIQVTTAIPSIRQHAQTLYMNVAQIVRNQPSGIPSSPAESIPPPPLLTPSSTISSTTDPSLEELPSSPMTDTNSDATGTTPSKLASAMSMLKLTRSSSDSRKDRPGAPKLQRGVTSGSTPPDHDGTRNPLEDVIHDTVHRSRLVASRANASKTSYDNVRPFSGVSAQELADQLTLVEAESYFSRVNPRELVNKSWTRDTKHRDAPHVMGIIELFDATAEWVSSEILHPQLQAAERAKLISLFVDAADHCLQLNNFNSLFEIVTGLSAPCIRQLNTTWGLMNAASLEKFQMLQQACSPEDNYRSYRQMFAAIEGQPRLPCSFVLVKDLFALEESMKTVEDGLVNWTKFRKISKLIYEMLDRQNTNYLPADGSSAVGISRKGKGALHHDRNMQVQIRHRLETIRKDSSVLFQLARNANTQESIMFVTSLSEAGFL